MKMPQSGATLEETLMNMKPATAQSLLASGPVDAKGRYMHWDEMRVRKPPAGLTLEDWWFGTKLARVVLAKQLPMWSTTGQAFRFSNVDPVQECLHHIDQRASGEILAENDDVTSLRSSKRYLVSSLTEEAITSSQLEGASTTRQVAKELLATGRPPRDRSERMIVNNYRGMQFALEHAESGEPLTPEFVLDLHRILTEGTLDDPNDAGRLQTPEDERVSVYWDTGKPEELKLHQPPAALELPERLDRLCQFANGELDNGFIHPVVRAILLHFSLAYDHPFADGNGRTARALFYWSMLHDGYWLAQYLSVSSILRKAPAQYAKSYLYVETDESDATYFVVYQLSVIEKAIQALHDYLARKMSETREVADLFHGSLLLNERQLTIVRDALRDPTELFTIAVQARRFAVTYESARSDLTKLQNLGLFSRVRSGKKYVFRPEADLPKLLRGLAESA